ncbi:DNA-binding transcriptional regulator, MarR family [Singulisphaera sp. GP187]|uniref:MarR family winged helix-turn-helix transcriptional regulator n=1 Tax=Singulisphaera sp. GP187 TaxID=1882752 RepID=UPI0009269B48|nr:MarR family transcriptional regulator [Singulisphaera sp. GP187]SIN74341.1 DNA-binding transcriptional regulator, MarR family [Singulisphaera sp. GP187]
MAWVPKNTAENLIGRTARLLTRVGDARLKSLGLAGAHLPIFAALQDGSGLSQTELARIACVEQPTMAGTLSRMEREGLIQREPDPTDRRSSLIRLTPAALAKLPDLLAMRTQYAEEALAGFDDAERKLLAGMLLRIITNVQNTSGPEDGRSSIGKDEE